jgi:hypothetical protein
MVISYRLLSVLWISEVPTASQKVRSSYFIYNTFIGVYLKAKLVNQRQGYTFPCPTSQIIVVPSFLKHSNLILLIAYLNLQ